MCCESIVNKEIQSVLLSERRVFFDDLVKYLIIMINLA